MSEYEFQCGLVAASVLLGKYLQMMFNRAERGEEFELLYAFGSSLCFSVAVYVALFHVLLKALLYAR